MYVCKLQQNSWLDNKLIDEVGDDMIDIPMRKKAIIDQTSTTVYIAPAQVP